MAGLVIGLDVGQKRTGIATASTEARLAQPEATVETEKLAAEITRLGTQHSVHAVVVGLPRNLDGNDTIQTDWVRQWIKELRRNFKYPFFWQDEALTTSEAANRPKSKDVDAEAAAIILQDWLDSDESSRVNC